MDISTYISRSAEETPSHNGMEFICRLKKASSRDEKSQLRVGVRRANRQQTTLPSACPSDFVIPLAKYRKSVYGTQLSVGMRFGMMFETEES
ncbi:auxin response factor 5-like, partial [Trifolium medium]|nr:auxin response factor 5-like [Trifolium medium]